MTSDDQRLFTARPRPRWCRTANRRDTRRGTLARILEYQASGGSFVPRREFAYPVDPLPEPGFTPGTFISGLVELLALGETELLSLERAYAEESGGARRNMNRVRIFQRVARRRHRHLVLRLAARTARRDARAQDAGAGCGRRPRAASALPGVENFEGMGFGPPLPDGSRTVLLVSDDNFSERQRTAFLLFRLIER